MRVRGKRVRIRKREREREKEGERAREIKRGVTEIDVPQLVIIFYFSFGTNETIYFGP